MLREYVGAVPGYAKKLAAMHLRTLKQSLDIQLSETAHRRQLERDEQATVGREVAAETEIARVGQNVAAGAAGGALLLCGWVAWLGYPTTTTALGLSVPVSLVTAFIYGRRKTPESTAFPKQPSAGAAPAGPVQPAPFPVTASRPSPP